MRSSAEAAGYVKKVRSLVRYLETCDGDMEKGNLRADVNVSVRKPGGELGTRCEIKNVNSMRFIAQAIEYEARRQIDILEGGGEIDQETRLFNADTGKTKTMRSKEDAHDYRYFPCPDLLPVKLSQEYVDGIKSNLPELPDAKRARFVDEYGLSVYDASVLVSDREKSAYYEIVAKGNDKKLSANWVINEVFGKLNKENIEIEDSPVSAHANNSIVAMIVDKTISGKIAKQVFEICWNEGGDPAKIVDERGLKQVTDTGAIEAMIDEIIAANPDQAAAVKDKPKTLGWFVGQVMKASGGKANPQAVNQILRSKLL
jgi:aspartyl-tRNA(Asn)/glutamyl-tRNA(Gln) amidotransferase subunit B